MESSLWLRAAENHRLDPDGVMRPRKDIAGPCRVRCAMSLGAREARFVRRSQEARPRVRTPRIGAPVRRIRAHRNVRECRHCCNASPIASKGARESQSDEGAGASRSVMPSFHCREKGVRMHRACAPSCGGIWGRARQSRWVGARTEGGESIWHEGDTYRGTAQIAANAVD
ncbi:hypothetical protein BC628DRAFT_642318 [Trametes gibbosa]|nr:hypothetical protein BC628DRAFT_642318 [Trametes gibbosa]